MADTYTRTGTVTFTPTNPGDAGEVDMSYSLAESMSVKTSEKRRYELTTDGAVTVSLGGMAAVHVFAVKVSGGHCKVTLTTADGDAVLRPDASGSLHYTSRTYPVLGIEIQREPAVPVVVKLVLAEIT